MTVIHLRIGRAPTGDRVSVYIGRAPDMLHLAGIIWTNPEDTRELVQRLQEPSLQPEWVRYDRTTHRGPSHALSRQ